MEGNATRPRYETIHQNKYGSSRYPQRANGGRNPPLLALTHEQNTERPGFVLPEIKPLGLCYYSLFLIGLLQIFYIFYLHSFVCDFGGLFISITVINCF